MKTVSEQELQREAEHIVSSLRPKQSATVIGLYGDLGAGKTTFVKACARALGITERVTSPTFVIEKIYTLKHQKFLHLIHIDAYRLKSGRELEKLGWDSIIADSKNIIIIEWADVIDDILPKDVYKIHLSVAGEHTRTLSYGGN